jgi:CBS domain-containing protein
MKIGEIMTKDVFTLTPEKTALEGVRVLLERKISGLPVVDGPGKLVGMFTEKDVLKAVLPSYVCVVGRFIYENNPQTVKNKIAQLSRLKVGDLMRKDVVTVSPETAVSEAAHVTLTRNVRRIPVVDPHGLIVGIVARSDVLDQLLK